VSSELVMANFNGQWVVGKKGKEHGVEVLRDPLAYWIANGKHGVVALPDDPEVIPMTGATFWYPLKEGGEVIELFVGARSGLHVPDNKIVMS